MNQKKSIWRSLSAISVIHYWKLLFRSALFFGATLLYILNRPENAREMFMALEKTPFILGIIWLIFVVEMILRFFPSKLESMGCQKQFARNYIPLQQDAQLISPRRGSESILVVVLSWSALNGAIGLLYFSGVIDACVLLLISLAYSVCDMICILFFCPFQTWMMKNKCCGSCRIYNWDYAMMFTPLLFVPSFYTWSLLGLAIVLLVTWEILHYIHPERFSEKMNASLSCSSCPEKLCHHKKQLHRFWTREKERLLCKTRRENVHHPEKNV